MRAIELLALLLLALLLLASPASAAHTGEYAPEDYLVYYGAWDAEQVGRAKDFDLVIAHPGESLGNITRRQVRALQDAGAKVILYVSIGETREVPRGPAAGKGEGPVHFEKGVGVVRDMKGYPSYYLDERSYVFDKKGFFEWREDGMPELVKGQDGIPDENGRWNSYFVYVGDPGWQDQVIQRMRTMVELFSPDGFFLDTLDAASEWGDYEFMQEDMAKFVARIGERFPKHYIIANRGLYLFERYPDLVRPAVDGVMFESFITEWDWYRKRGVLNPWLEANLRIMKKSLLPQSEKPDGFHLFMLNYLDPEQSDFMPLVADMHELLEGARCSEYVSTPDLQKIRPPASSFYSGSGALPKLAWLSVMDEGQGRFTLEIETLGDGFTFGRDVFADIRYTVKGQDDLMTAERVHFDYDMARTGPTPEGRKMVIDSYGLHNFKEYTFHARLLGRKRGLVSEEKTVRLITGGTGRPDVTAGLKAHSREKSVLLEWDAGQAGIKRYNVYMGAHPQKMTLVKSTRKPSILIKRLRNNDVYYFTVAAVDKEGDEGALAWPITGYPRKSEQPLPPRGLQAGQTGPGELTVRWEKSLDAQVKAYRVYCFREDKGLRLPVETDPKTFEKRFTGLEKGVPYKVFVTTLDFDGIQSPPGRARTVVLD